MTLQRRSFLKLAMMKCFDILISCRSQVWHSFVSDRACLSLCEVISGDHAQIPSIVLYSRYALHPQKYQYMKFLDLHSLKP